MARGHSATDTKRSFEKRWNFSRIGAIREAQVAFDSRVDLTGEKFQVDSAHFLFNKFKKSKLGRFKLNSATASKSRQISQFYITLVVLVGYV
jgi:hypothetical protein